MTQMDRLARISAAQAEDAHDLFEALAHDGVICARDMEVMRQALDHTVAVTQRADLADELATLVGRRGPEGDRFDRLMRSWHGFNDRPATQDALAEIQAA